MAMEAYVIEEGSEQGCNEWLKSWEESWSETKSNAGKQGKGKD